MQFLINEMIILFDRQKYISQNNYES